MTIQQNIKLATDAVVFGYDKTGIYLLLIERKHPSRGISWALPGGFVEDNESAEQAVVRELKEETSLSIKAMKQFHTFSEVKRSEEHTSELQSRGQLVCRLLLDKKKKNKDELN